MQTKQTKVCSKCKMEFPATTEYFARLTRNNDGLRSECKECKKKIDSEWRFKNRKPKFTHPRINVLYTRTGFKKCAKCGIEYQVSKEFFEPSKRCSDGFRGVCRICKSDYYNRKLQRMKEKAKTTEHKQKQRERYAGNKEHILESIKKYNRSELGKQCKRRSVFQSLKVSLTHEQWDRCKRYFDNKCAYCGNEGALEQEHFIPLSKGGEFSSSNIIPSCKFCNSSKHINDFFEWYPRQPYYSQKREKKILSYLNYSPQTKCQQLSIII